MREFIRQYHSGDLALCGCVPRETTALAEGMQYLTGDDAS